MQKPIYSRLAALLAGGKPTPASQALADHLVERARAIGDGDIEAHARLAVRLIRHLINDSPKGSVAVGTIGQLLMAVLHHAGNQPDPGNLANLALAHALSQGWIMRLENGRFRLTARAHAASGEPLRTWMVPDLPETLIKLARFLESRGNTATAAEIEKIINGQPARVLSKFRKRWARWIDRHIKRQSRGVYRLQ